MSDASAQAGLPLILTADQTLLADYPTLLDGMMGTVQTTVVPEMLMRRVLSPAMPCQGVRAVRGPLGLRRLEAVLRRAGWAERDVAIVPPHRLKAAIGPATRVVALSSGDPLGLGMTSTTMSAATGGQPYTQRWFAKLCALLRRRRQSGLNFRIVAGGPGAWQLQQQPAAARELGIDTVVVGYAERDLPALMARFAAGEPVGPVVTAAATGPGEIPPILGATVMGVVEISRGCGRGCGFCTLAEEPVSHLPIEQIVADARTNIAGGAAAISLIAEDLFRYGAGGAKPECSRLMEMLAAVRAAEGLRMIQVDHANVSSVAQMNISELREINRLLRVSPRHRHVWVNLGVETASGELMAANGLAGKISPFGAVDWPELCNTAVRRLIEAGFMPMASLILGLPGETPGHLRQTMDLIERWAGLPMVAFPIFYVAVRPEERPFEISRMSELHWRLFSTCYDFNFRWIPPLIADNQRAAAAPRSRRLFIQMAGRGQKLQWKWRLWRAIRRARR